MVPTTPPRARHAARAPRGYRKLFCLLFLFACVLTGVFFRVGAMRLFAAPRGPTLALMRSTFQRLIAGSDTTLFGNVYALRASDGGDAILTASERERDTLVASGLWVETCSPLAAQSAFCVRGSELDLQHGSFAVVANSSTPVNSRSLRRKLKLLLRCVTVSSSARHFFSLDRTCEGIGEPDAELGWLAERPDDEMLRPLRRCVDADGLRVHALDDECDEPFTADPLYPSVLGYVQ